jgi:hypothetical protein
MYKNKTQSLLFFITKTASELFANKERGLSLTWLVDGLYRQAFAKGAKICRLF